MRPEYAAPLSAVDRCHARAGPEGALEITASKEVTAGDPYLPAHFPGEVVYPGVFILETVRQAVTAVLGERAGELPEVAVVRSLRLRSALRPGERLTVCADVGPPGPGGEIPVRARCARDGGAEVAALRLEFRYGPAADG